MGNFSGETVIGSTGSSIPARIASRLLAAMEQSADNTPAVSPENPAGPMPPDTVETWICALSGMEAGPYCTGHAREWMPKDKSIPVCIWHTGAGLFYPPEYRTWLSERFRAGGTRQEADGRIKNPVHGSVYYIDPSVPADAQALRVETNGFGADTLLYADGILMGSLNYAGVFALPLARGSHVILVEDSEGASSSVEFEVR
jgi:penicillin-binding protein 1C